MYTVLAKPDLNESGGEEVHDAVEATNESVEATNEAEEAGGTPVLLGLVVILDRHNPRRFLVC